jgi:hypothetical protein
MKSAITHLADFKYFPTTGWTVSISEKVPGSIFLVPHGVLKPGEREDPEQLLRFELKRAHAQDFLRAVGAQLAMSDPTPAATNH